MPKGKGTYGSKRGRPKYKSKTDLRMEKAEDDYATKVFYDPNHPDRDLINRVLADEYNQKYGKKLKADDSYGFLRPDEISGITKKDIKRAIKKVFLNPKKYSRTSREINMKIPYKKSKAYNRKFRR